MSDRIELDAPDLGAVEKQYLNAAVDGGYVSTFGPWIGDFEHRFAGFVGVERAVAVQSGTAALHMALYVSGIKAGDEVILPSTTFAATLHAVMYVGATPVIVDVDRATWCLSPTAFSAAVSKRTKAVIPVHLYGNVCDMTSINAIAASKGIIVIEDATESLGATLNGQQAGTLGDIGCYSFNGNKLMTTGSGGMIVTKDLKILDRLVYLINQANPREGIEGYNEMGFNYRMPNLNAALGMAQLNRVNGFLKLKRSFHQIYETQLGGDGACILQKAYSGANPSWWFTAVLLKDAGEASRLGKRLKEFEIPSREIFRPLHTFAYAKGFRRTGCDNAEMIYQRGLCLPSSTLNDEETVRHICAVIKKVLV